MPKKSFEDWKLRHLEELRLDSYFAVNKLIEERDTADDPVSVFLCLVFGAV
jgi:hypothetical protein